MIKKSNHNKRKGQAGVEYIITVSVVVLLFTFTVNNQELREYFMESMSGFFNDIVSMQNLPIP